MPTVPKRLFLKSGVGVGAGCYFYMFFKEAGHVFKKDQGSRGYDLPSFFKAEDYLVPGIISFYNIYINIYFFSCGGGRGGEDAVKYINLPE